MKLADLLTSVLGQLQGRKEYGISLISLLQSQIHHDPSKVVNISDVDGRGTKVMLLAKGKEVDLHGALKSHIDASHHIELDVDRDSGLTLDRKGLRVTVEWRKRTSAERIQDTKDRVLTPTGRLSFPHLFAVDEKKARHGANYATGGIVAVDYSALEERALQHYVGQFVQMGVSASIRDGKVVLDLESIRPKAEPMVNCRCAIKEKKSKKSIDVLTTSLKHGRRESTLPRDMLSGGGLKLPIVGGSYRSPEEQRVLAGKNVGNMVLIAHEPDNAADPNALAVFAWNSGVGSRWYHVGYIQAVVAAGLVGRLRQLGGGSTSSVAFKGTLLDDPGLASSPRLQIEGVWHYPIDLRA